MSGRPDGSRAAGPPREVELRVNPISCDAHRLCAELLPELISVDPWGYPVVRPGPVPVRLLALARRAVAACPTLALMLADYEPARSRPAQGRQPRQDAAGVTARTPPGRQARTR